MKPILLSLAFAAEEPQPALPDPVASVADTGQYLSPAATVCLANAGVPKGLEADRIPEKVRSEAYGKCAIKLDTCATSQVTYSGGVEIRRRLIAEYPCVRIGPSSSTLRAPDYLGLVSLPDAQAVHQRRLTTLNVVRYAGMGTLIASVVPLYMMIAAESNGDDILPAAAATTAMFVVGYATWEFTERPLYRTRVDPTRFLPQEQVDAATLAYDSALKQRLQYVASATLPAPEKAVLDLDDETEDDAKLKQAFEESEDE